MCDCQSILAWQVLVRVKVSIPLEDPDISGSHLISDISVPYTKLLFSGIRNHMKTQNAVDLKAAAKLFEASGCRH